MIKKLISLIILVFLFGWIGNNVYSDIYKDSYELKLTQDQTNNLNPTIVSKEQNNPKDRIKESQIHVYDNTVVIEINDPEWSTFTDTNSMDPVIDKGANAIHIVPKYEDDLEIGDIVAYESKYAKGTIIHRIIDIKYDEEGKYFILKGDNNPKEDPGKIRFSQIKRVLVAIIY
jgi:hypothetical protein